jgi:hypothetical protein
MIASNKIVTAEAAEDFAEAAEKASPLPNSARTSVTSAVKAL